MVGSDEEAFSFVLLRLLGGELVGVRVTRCRIRARAGRLVLGIEDSVEIMCLTGMPLVPSGGINVRSHLAVEINDGSVGAPWPAKVNVRLAGVGGEAAVVEDEGGLLVGEVLALRRKIATRSVQRAVNLAIIEDGVAIAVDEVDVAGDNAMREVATGDGRSAGDMCRRHRRLRWWEGRGTGRRCPQTSCLAATTRADVERVLVGEDVNTVEDIAVAFHVERLRL